MSNKNIVKIDKFLKYDLNVIILYFYLTLGRIEDKNKLEIMGNYGQVISELVSDYHRILKNHKKVNILKIVIF